VVLAEYPSPNFQETRALELLQRTGLHTPLIYLIQTMSRQTTADFNNQNTGYCVDMENLGHLPVVIRRILSESKLREQCDRAEKKLRHSEARYRALAGNPTYGICRWNVEGKFLDVNQALVTMLGYTSKRDLMTEDSMGAIIRDPSRRRQILERSSSENRVAPIEIHLQRRHDSKSAT
jgi:PAS domain-containing protein